MKLRVTPLNLLVAVCLAYGAYELVKGSGTENNAIHDSERRGLYLLGAAFLLFVSDMVFRIMLPHANIKKIGLIQFVFIIFVAILMILFSR